ncbi:MAG: FAD-binding oxidoreductase [Bacteroidota bacterium]|nr:FAD-binding oxidoreductase [Candidatus Kapabacteria bacterium]MCX7936826.1 FAD-binding oxidoreductase [Chlorobiota bacterium]MDW8270979.1 FAD-binding oxidoreductase [Bacteroidota bacterium]
MQKPVHITARIHARRDADKGKKYFEVELEPAEKVHYQPGQYLNLVLEGQRRSYSITNLPQESNKSLWLLVERIKGGIASTFLDNAPLGTSVEIVLPFGRLLPQEDKARHHVLVGTGSGIAPLKPIAEWITRNYDHTVELLWGLREKENIFWEDWLEQMAKTYPNFRYQITLSQPDPEWKGLSGRVTEHLQRRGFEENTYFYLCGGKQMLDDVRTILKSKGVPATQILTEQFHV